MAKGNHSALVDAQGNRLICRHCHKAKVNRPRGMCWSCYYRPGVLDLYPVTSKYARRGVGRRNSSGGKGEPVDAVPRSEEKLAAMERRAALGLDLFQEGDQVEPPASVSPGRVSEVVYRYPRFHGHIPHTMESIKLKEEVCYGDVEKGFSGRGGPATE